jgi:hypothetical protein
MLVGITTPCAPHVVNIKEAINSEAKLANNLGTFFLLGLFE